MSIFMLLWFLCFIFTIFIDSVPIGMIADHHQAVWCWWCTQPFISESSWNTCLNNWTHKWTVGWIYPKSWQPSQKLEQIHLLYLHKWYSLPATMPKTPKSLQRIWGQCDWRQGILIQNRNFAMWTFINQWNVTHTKENIWII